MKLRLIKICPHCSKQFQPNVNQQKFCSITCKLEHLTIVMRDRMRRKRHPPITGEQISPYICQVCGYDKTFDIHHEGIDGYVLCPNHHALITRGIEKIESYNIKPLAGLPVKKPKRKETEKRRKLEKLEWKQPDDITPNFTFIKPKASQKCPHGNIVCGICTMERNRGKSTQENTH